MTLFQIMSYALIVKWIIRMECYLSVSNLVFKNTYIVAKTGTNACHTQKKLSQDEKNG